MFHAGIPNIIKIMMIIKKDIYRHISFYNKHNEQD